jgi:hypothetical protein
MATVGVPLLSPLSRSENSIKNHWNATKRSLGKERWVTKKSGQVPLAFGQLSPLEKYIISLEETSRELEQMDNPHEVQAFPNSHGATALLQPTNNGDF